MTLEEKIKDYKNKIQSYEAIIAEEQANLEALRARTDLPEKTDTLEKIQKTSGRKVTIEDGFGKEETTFEFKDGNVILASGRSLPLIGAPGHGPKEIVDSETGEAVFENPYYDEKISVQYAMLLGKQAGLEEAQIEIDAAADSKAFWEQCLNETKDLAGVSK